MQTVPIYTDVFELVNFFESQNTNYEVNSGDTEVRACGDAERPPSSVTDGCGNMVRKQTTLLGKLANAKTDLALAILSGKK